MRTRTRTRLDSVFEKAFPVPFDDSSKFVFFSDIHRGDDSLSDEFGRNKHIFYHALNYYYQNDFTYVEVGDGDELWEYPKFDVIRSAHTTTFEMLKMFYKDNRLILLFGNHNIHFRDDEYVKNTLYKVHDEYLGTQVDLFPGIKVHEALILSHRETNQRVFVVHGHQGGLFSDRLLPVQQFFIRFLWRYLHLAGVKHAASPASNRRKRHKVEKLYTKWNENHGIIIICGHTHRPKFPEPGEHSFFNTGCCMHPRGITCLELIYGKLVLVTWSVHAKKDGLLYVKRTAVKGPEPIRSYMKGAKSQ